MMRGARTSIAGALFAAVCALAFAAWGDSWNAIRNASRDIAAIEATFVQKKETDLLAAPAVARGRFSFRAPHSLRWEYVSPARSVLLMHGGKARRYVMKDGRWARDRAAGAGSMQFVLQEISLWMKGNFDANPGFTPELRPGRVIVLTPKEGSMARYVAGIELRLSKRPGVISSVTIRESASSRTVISFAGVKLNAPMDNSVFTVP